MKKNDNMKITNAPQGKTEARLNGKVIGYAKDDILYGIDKDGYAVEIGTVNHRVEIPTKLREWLNSVSA